jgi:predicted ester cyclase
MSTDEHKARARRWRELCDQRDPSAAEYLAPDAVVHLPGAPGPLNREQVLGLLARFYAAFPDLHHTVEDQVAEGETVVTRMTLRGTHRGEFQGIAPTGKPITVSLIGIDRFEHGTFVEQWSQLDTLGLLHQLGAIPAPGPGTR